MYKFRRVVVIFFFSQCHQSARNLGKRQQICGYRRNPRCQCNSDLQLHVNIGVIFARLSSNYRCHSNRILLFLLFLKFGNEYWNCREKYEPKLTLTSMHCGFNIINSAFIHKPSSVIQAICRPHHLLDHYLLTSLILLVTLLTFWVMRFEDI